MDADEEAILASARQAGLSKAAIDFKQDVLAAAAASRSFRTGLGTLSDTTCEPWPPMRTGRLR